MKFITLILTRRIRKLKELVLELKDLFLKLKELVHVPEAEGAGPLADGPVPEAKELVLELMPVPEAEGAGP
jgi:hypothetical protein